MLRCYPYTLVPKVQSGPNNMHCEDTTEETCCTLLSHAELLGLTYFFKCTMKVKNYS